MKVILSTEIDKLGNAGDLVSVKDGYARNFLIPRGLAIRANERNVNELRHQQRAMEARRGRLLAEAQEALVHVEKVDRIVMTRSCGPEGKLFGSVTTKDIVEALLNEYEVTIDKRQVALNTPIKTMGDFDVIIKLGQGVTGTVQVCVEPDEASAALVAKAKAAAALAAEKEDDRKAQEAAAAEAEEAAAVGAQEGDDAGDGDEIPEIVEEGAYQGETSSPEAVDTEEDAGDASSSDED